MVNGDIPPSLMVLFFEDASNLQFSHGWNGHCKYHHEVHRDQNHDGKADPH